MTFSLNDLESQIRALEGVSVSSSDLSGADSSVSESQSSETESFSGYSADSSDTSESEASEGSEEEYINQRVDQGKVNYEKKARETSRKKARFGMSDICFKFNIGQCRLEDCIFRHVKLESLNEEEKGDLVRDLRRKPFDPELGLIVKQLNIPICKTFSKTGECKFLKCRFWHIDSENDAKWAGCPFWCGPCRKAFTGETQLREHSNGKLHKQNSWKQ